MNKCICGNKYFESTFDTLVTFKLENKTLTALEEEKLGSDGIYRCTKCDKEYQTKDFENIIIQ